MSLAVFVLGAMMSLAVFVLGAGVLVLLPRGFVATFVTLVTFVTVPASAPFCSPPLLVHLDVNKVLKGYLSTADITLRPQCLVAMVRMFPCLLTQTFLPCLDLKLLLLRQHNRVVRRSWNRTIRVLYHLFTLVGFHYKSIAKCDHVQLMGLDGLNVLLGLLLPPLLQLLASVFVCRHPHNFDWRDILQKNSAEETIILGILDVVRQASVFVHILGADIPKGTKHGNLNLVCNLLNLF